MSRATFILRLGAWLATTTASALASAAASADYEVEHDLCDAGGGVSTAGPYRQHASAGGMPAGSTGHSAVAAMEGFAGQLWHPRELRLEAPESAPEASAFQLACSLELDDSSLLRVSPALVQWSASSGPVEAISASGLVSTGHVHAATPAVIRGVLGTLSAARPVSIVDVFKDDFSLYAGDGIDDAWQVEHFGLDNPDAAADADPTGSGQDNLFKFTAGLDPKDPQSRFIVDIVHSAQTKWVTLRMGPCFHEKNYGVEYSYDLAHWQPAETAVRPDKGSSTWSCLDSGTGLRKRFYRVVITRK